MKSIVYIVFALAVLYGCSDDPYNAISTFSPAITDSGDHRPIELSTPELNISVGIEGGGVDLNWSESNGASFYTLQTDVTPAFNYPVILYSGPDNTHQLDNLYMVPEIRQYFRVRAENETSRSNWSNIDYIF